MSGNTSGGSIDWFINDEVYEPGRDSSPKTCEYRSPNPIVFSTGNKVEFERDFTSQGVMGLYLERTYNKAFEGASVFGPSWVSTFDYQLATTDGACSPKPGVTECDITDTWPSSLELVAKRPDGRQIRFLMNETDGYYYSNKTAPVARLQWEVGDTWLLRTEEHTFERYSKGGLILEIKDEQGVGWTFTYGGLNGTQLQRVTHTSGRYVQLGWSGNQVTSVLDPAGNAYGYAYSGGMLSSAFLPGGTKVTYHYEDPRFSWALTGKSFNDVRYSIFGYDQGGRAVTSEHAGGVERYGYDYVYTGSFGEISQATETNPLGKQTVYQFANGKITKVTGNASTHCPLSSKTRTYDAFGYDDRVENFEGITTDYDYDGHGHLHREVAASGTSLARTTTYEWDEVGNRLLRQSTNGDAEISYTYTPNGRIASKSVKNLSGSGVANQVQTTTFSYTYQNGSTNGLLSTMVVDGPLSNDTVTYTYNATGDLQSIKNGLNHVTTLTDYSGLGLPGKVTGANGDVTEYIYDGRGRVTEQKAIVNGQAQVTRYVYSSAGLLASVKLPDAPQRNFAYDAARRLIEEYEREAGGTYASRITTYNAMSLPTKIEVQRTSYPNSTQVLGSIDGVVDNGAGGFNIRGWACSSGYDASIDVHLYAGGGWPSGTYLGAFTAKEASEPAVAAACTAQGTAYRFLIAVSDTMRAAHGGKAIYIHGISHAGKENLLIAGSGAFAIPRLPPTEAPSDLSAPMEVGDGQYTVSWSATVARATKYRLEESANGAAWVEVYADTGGSKPITGKTNGTYRYRVRACNEAGCGPYSAERSVREWDPPTGVPTLSAPAVNASGSYTVSWSAVGNATYYKVSEIQNSAYLQPLPDTSATTIALSGKNTSFTYTYLVWACNMAGCAPTYGSATVERPIYGAEFVGQSVPSMVVGGRQFAVTVQMRNTGNTTWTAAESYSLGSQNPHDNGNWGTNRMPVQGAVPPGGIATFTLNAWGPAEGTYNFQWRMVRDGVTWFGATTPNVSILSVTGLITANPNPCTLNVYQTVCTSVINWWSSQNGSEVLVTNIDNSYQQVFMPNTKSGSASAPWIPVPGKRFHLRYAGMTLATVDVYAYQTGQYPPEPDPPPCPTKYCQEP